MENLLKLSVEKVSALIKSKDLSPVDLTKASLKQINNLNPKLNAFVFVNEEQALSFAKKAEKEITNGNYFGKLHGIPVAYKDLYYTKDIPTTACSKVLKDFIPKYNATVVERLENAGCINLGKTNTTEFAFGPTNEESYFGAVRNPWDFSKISGGSSGGSAAAVASNMAFCAMGSDSGGSIRIPAAMCGVVGFKPSLGLVSTYGIIPMSKTMDHAGPLCRSVADIAIILDTITGTDHKDTSPFAIKGEPTQFYNSIYGVTNLKGKVLGIPKNFFFDKTDYQVEKVFFEAVEKLKLLGATIKEVVVPNTELITETSTNLMFKEAAESHKTWYPERKDDYQKDIPPRLEIGLKVTNEDYLKAVKYRNEIIKEWKVLTKQIDAVLVPTCPIEPFDIGLGEPWSVTTRGNTELGKQMATYHTRYSNMTGAPAISIFAGLTQNGLPVGLMIMGGFGADCSVLETGLAYERNFGFLSPNI